MVIDRNAITNDGHEDLAHVLSVGHVHKGSLDAFSLFGDIFGFQTSANGLHVHRDQIAVRRDHQCAG